MTGSSMAHASSNPAIQRVLGILTWITVLVILSLVLQIAGSFTPGWVCMDTGIIVAHVGIWYSRTCIYGVCTTRVTYADEPDDIQEPHSSLVGRDEYRGETTSAIIVGAAAAIALRIARTKLLTPGASNAKLLLITGGVFTLISGILSTIAAGKLADKTRKATESYKSAGEENPLRFPYSLLLTGLGGVLGLITFLLVLVSQPWQIRTGNQQPSQYAPQPGLYPAQMTAAQTTYPQSQTGNAYPQIYPPSAFPPGQPQTAFPPGQQQTAFPQGQPQTAFSPGQPQMYGMAADTEQTPAEKSQPFHEL